MLGLVVKQQEEKEEHLISHLHPCFSSPRIVQRAYGTDVTVCVSRSECAVLRGKCDQARTAYQGSLHLHTYLGLFVCLFVLLFMVKPVCVVSHIWHTLTIKLRTEFCASQQGSSYILNVQDGLWTYWSSLILTYNNMNSSYNPKSYLLLGSSRSCYSSAWCTDTSFVLEYGVWSVVYFQLCVPNLISQIKEKFI